MSGGSRRVRPFNTPLECGLRLLFVLDAKDGAAYDLQRLVGYDYLLVHSGDVPDGPPSLHPAVPFRGGELLIKRDLVKVGLSQMFSRELLEKRFSNRGITYECSGLTKPFLSLLRTKYAEALRSRAAWLVHAFTSYTDQEFERYMHENVGRLGTEFERMTAIKELEL